MHEEGTYLPNGAAAKSGLNKSMLDAGWGQFQQMCVAKAAYAGRTVVFVNPRYIGAGCAQDAARYEKRTCPNATTPASVGRNWTEIPTPRSTFSGSEGAHRLPIRVHRWVICRSPSAFRRRVLHRPAFDERETEGLTVSGEVDS